MHFEDEVAIVVERFDRLRLPGRTARVHQEDLAQALGVPPTNKYENEAGPGARAIVELLRHHSRHPEQDVTSFVLALAFHFMIAGTDAHSKNYALLIGAGGWVRLAPLYDVTSALTDPGAMKMNLAMRVRSLERKRGGKCSLCNGKGRLVITCEDWGYGEVSPPLIGCEGCGEFMHIHIVPVEKKVGEPV